MNFINRLLKNSRDEKFIHLLETIFEVLIKLIWNQWANTTKDCAIDLLSKYAWVVPLKDKRGITIVNAFQKIISKGRKPNKIWVDQGGEFYNKVFKRFFENK